VPFAFSGSQWVGYDDINSVTTKVNYINRNNLGGAMFWSIEQDDYSGKCGSLVTKAYSLFNSVSPATTTQAQVPITTTKSTTVLTCPATGQWFIPYRGDCTKFYQC
jgi:GH18 family chitinase